MDFFEVVQNRRSIRKYTDRKVPPEVIQRAIDAALLAPNSSNLQTWNFFWIRSPALKSKIVDACLQQGAAATAAELIVVVSDRGLWKRSVTALIEAQGGNQAHPQVLKYYKMMIPIIYGWNLLWPLKWIGFRIAGLFRPMMKRPSTPRDLDEVSIKSAALASQNFMNAISAQGFDSCPMEGFDESRVKSALKLNCRSRIVMVISIGERDPKGVWGPRYRLPRDRVFHEV